MPALLFILSVTGILFCLGNLIATIVAYVNYDTYGTRENARKVLVAPFLGSFFFLKAFGEHISGAIRGLLRDILPMKEERVLDKRTGKLVRLQPGDLLETLDDIVCGYADRIKKGTAVIFLGSERVCDSSLLSKDRPFRYFVHTAEKEKVTLGTLEHFAFASRAEDIDDNQRRTLLQ